MARTSSSVWKRLWSRLDRPSATARITSGRGRQPGTPQRPPLRLEQFEDRCVLAPVTSGLISFANFSTSAGLDLNGSAATTSNVLRLTPASTNLASSAFALKPLALNQGFSSYFQFNI